MFYPPRRSDLYENRDLHGNKGTCYLREFRERGATPTLREALRRRRGIAHKFLPVIIFQPVRPCFERVTVNGLNVELIPVPRARARGSDKGALARTHRGKANQIPMIPN